MLKRILWIMAFAAAALPAAADQLSDTVSALGKQSVALAQQMRPAGVNLTWGQDIAAADMERLAKAAGAINTMFVDEDEHTFDELSPLVTELQTAAIRVKSSAPISVLDQAQQQQALALVDQAAVLKTEVDTARRVAEEQAAARRAQSSSSFGFGLGYGWGWPGYYGGGFGWPGYGYGYPGWGWGSRFGVGFGVPIYSGGRRCR